MWFYYIVLVDILPFHMYSIDIDILTWNYKRLFDGCIAEEWHESELTCCVVLYMLLFPLHYPTKLKSDSNYDENYNYYVK